MRIHAIKEKLRRQAKADYDRWLCNEELSGSALFGGEIIAGASISDFLGALNEVHSQKPEQVDYGLIYSACVLSRNFSYLKELMLPQPDLYKEDLLTLFQFAIVFLNVGLYDQCIDCCDFCMREKYRLKLEPRQAVKILFAKSKAQRNMGRYSQALEDLQEALLIIADNKEKIEYLMGAALIRIGKVYSQYLMMMSVSLCFLNEAKERLEPWLDWHDPAIREEANKEYAICLDSIGQYWKRKGDLQQAEEFFQQAMSLNEQLGRLTGVFRVHSHMIMTQYKRLSHDQDGREQLGQIMQDQKYIIRKMEDDSVNQRGVSVRLLHLAEVQLELGQISDAEHSLKKSYEVAMLYRDEKTLMRLEIAELEHGALLGNTDRKRLADTIETARKRNSYGYEIELNNAIISAINQGQLSREKHLGALNRNRTLYLYLSDIAQETIRKVSETPGSSKRQNEFTYLSEHNSKDLLMRVVTDYDIFIQRINEIIDQLLQITEQRSKDLNKAILAEAKASLASGVLHDLKHILTDSATESSLDTALKEIRKYEAEGSPESLGHAEEIIQMVNKNLKELIFPRIEEATRVPNDFKCDIKVAEIFAEASQLQFGGSAFAQGDGKTDDNAVNVEIDCPKDISLCYNREIFFNLIKEMLRNALDYQKKAGASAVKYIMEGRDLEGEVEIRLLTEFADRSQAERANKQISDQLSEKNVEEDGFGIRALRGFVQYKTGGACRAEAVINGNRAGISFSVPRK